MIDGILLHESTRVFLEWSIAASQRELEVLMGSQECEKVDKSVLSSLQEFKDVLGSEEALRERIRIAIQTMLLQFTTAKSMLGEYDPPLQIGELRLHDSAQVMLTRLERVCLMQLGKLAQGVHVEDIFLF
ncbi:MAG: hypothetical protein V1853_00025 [bacterium]